MAYSIPSWLLPAVDALGVHWPDINEDDVSKLGSDLFDFGSKLTDLGYTVADVLTELAHSNESEMLNQMRSHWATLQREFLEPADALFTTANRFCDDAYNAIHIYKATLLGYLDVEVGSILLSGGVALALKVVGRHVIDRAVHRMLEDVEARLEGAFYRRLDAEVRNELHGLVRKAMATVDDHVYQSVAPIVATVGSTMLSGRLTVSEEELASAAIKIERRIADIYSAASQLTSSHLLTSYHQTTHAHADTTLRVRLIGFLDSFIPDVVSAVETLCARLIQHTSGLVDLFGDHLDQADRELAQAAKAGIAITLPVNQGSISLGTDALQPAAGIAALGTGAVVTTFTASGTKPSSATGSATTNAAAQESGYATPEAAEAAYRAAADIRKNANGVYVDRWGADADNCTSWAIFRRSKLGLPLPHGDGGEMAASVGIVGQDQVHPGSLISYPSADGDGHVMVVEKVVNLNPPTFVVSEMNYDFHGAISVATIVTQLPNGSWTKALPGASAYPMPPPTFSQ
jgi:surface antigen